MGKAKGQTKPLARKTTMTLEQLKKIQSEMEEEVLTKCLSKAKRDILADKTLYEAIQYLDRIGESLEKVSGLAGILLSAGLDEDNLEPRDVRNTAWVLHELAGKIEFDYNQFWAHYEKFKEGLRHETQRPNEQNGRNAA